MSYNRERKPHCYNIILDHPIYHHSINRNTELPFKFDTQPTHTQTHTCWHPRDRACNQAEHRTYAKFWIDELLLNGTHHPIILANLTPFIWFSVSYESNRIRSAFHSFSFEYFNRFFSPPWNSIGRWGKEWQKWHVLIVAIWQCDGLDFNTYLGWFRFIKHTHTVQRPSSNYAATRQYHGIQEHNEKQIHNAIDQTMTQWFDMEAWMKDGQREILQFIWTWNCWWID